MRFVKQRCGFVLLDALFLLFLCLLLAALALQGGMVLERMNRIVVDEMEQT